MAEWIPILILPNLDMRSPIECEHAAIVSVRDERVENLRAQHPRLTTFLSKFETQFGSQAWPALFLLSDDTGPSFRTADAVTAFRDILSMAIVPYARASRLHYDRSSELAFSNVFQFYPWMLDAKYEELFLINPAQMHVHLLDEFRGQSFPEQPQVSISDTNMDLPLAAILLNRWVTRFSEGAVEWKDKALFRSLAMANEAARIPALTAATFYDIGRSLALWVSAYEILAHPGDTGQSNFGTVSALLENVDWLFADLAAEEHAIQGKVTTNKILAVWICKKIYDLRNDYLHGNEVDPDALKINGRVVIDFAACIFRMALTGFLNLRFDATAETDGDNTDVRRIIGQRVRFNMRQELFERALLSALSH